MIVGHISSLSLSSLGPLVPPSFTTSISLKLSLQSFPFYSSLLAGGKWRGGGGGGVHSWEWKNHTHSSFFSVVYLNFFQDPFILPESGSVTPAFVCVRLEDVVEPTEAEIWLTFSSVDGTAEGNFVQMTIELEQLVIVTC